MGSRFNRVDHHVGALRIGLCFEECGVTVLNTGEMNGRAMADVRELHCWNLRCFDSHLARDVVSH